MESGIIPESTFHQMRSIMKENVVFDKSKNFAIRIINLYKYLCDTKKEYVLSKQVLRSGTSIGANIAESECAISKKDFLSKLYVALKETSETLYWLELLYKTEYIDKQMYQSMHNDCEEIKRILQASTKTISAEM